MRTILVLNPKGGCGKNAIAINILRKIIEKLILTKDKECAEEED